MRGDGSLAGTAVLAALADDAEHPMAGMLDTALQDAVRPEEIRELLVPARRRRQGASPRADPATQFTKTGTAHLSGPRSVPLCAGRRSRPSRPARRSLAAEPPVF